MSSITLAPNRAASAGLAVEAILTTDASSKLKFEAVQKEVRAMAFAGTMTLNVTWLYEKLTSL